MIVDTTLGLPVTSAPGSPQPPAAHRLRRLIAQPEMLVVPTAHDALSARLIELAGFEAVAVDRRGVTASTLASVDLYLADVQELLVRAATAGTAVSIPLVIDLSPGPLDVVRTRRAVAESIKVGIAAFVISDCVQPGAVLPADDMDALLRAALDLRAGTGDIVLVGKAHVPRDADADGIAAAIDRAARWLQTGVDLVQVDQLRTRHDHETFAATVPQQRLHSASAHLNVEDFDSSFFAEMGYAVAVWPPVLLEAAAAGMQAALDRTNNERDVDDVGLPHADLDVLLGARSLDDLRSRY